MASTGYERQKRLRKRRRAGHIVLPIEVDPGALADVLIEAGYLAAWNCSDREAVREALQTAIESWTQASPHSPSGGRRARNFLQGPATALRILARPGSPLGLA